MGEQLPQQDSRLGRVPRVDSEQDDSRRRGDSQPNRELPKIAIKSDQDSILDGRSRQDLEVGGTRHDVCHREDVMAFGAKGSDARRRKILVGENPH